MTGEFHRSIGVELGGTRTDRTAVAHLDWFPRLRKVILVDIETPLTGHDDTSSDETLIASLAEAVKRAHKGAGLGLHAPLSLPPYFSTDGKKRPLGVTGPDPEVRWMRAVWQRLRPRPKPFVPYLQRPAEIWLRHLTPEKFIVPDALGSNWAPLAARAQFLKPHWPAPALEVFPRAALHRFVSALGLPKNIIRYYTDVERGPEYRDLFLTGFTEALPQVFIYEKDLENMVLHMNCFNAFLAAFTQHLASRGECEAPPKGYPKKAGWIHIPSKNPDWSKVF